jgi:hypothetical protein
MCLADMYTDSSTFSSAYCVWMQHCISKYRLMTCVEILNSLRGYFVALSMRHPVSAAARTYRVVCVMTPCIRCPLYGELALWRSPFHSGHCNGALLRNIHTHTHTYVPNIAASQTWRTRCYVTFSHPTRTAHFWGPDTFLSALLPNIFNLCSAVQMRPTTQCGHWWRSVEISWLTRGGGCTARWLLLGHPAFEIT